MAVNVSEQYNGGFLPDIILLTLCYYHRGTRLYAMKMSCLGSLVYSPTKRSDGMLRRFRCVQTSLETIPVASGKYHEDTFCRPTLTLSN